ncbi:MAG: LuxR C-terminal-related transcriptional regulator [bacterium]|nr:LuxR C-terminal-related transcriptional regulator [bacterium]
MALIKRSYQMKQLDLDMHSISIAYFCAHMGWGKTTFIKQYFEEYNLNGCFLSVKDSDFITAFDSALNSGAEHIVIDDAHLLTDIPDGFSMLFNRMLRSAKVYILSRCALPAFFRPYSVTGHLKVYGTGFFALSAKETAYLFERNGKMISYAAAENIRSNTKGWIFGTMAVLRRISGNALTQEVIDQCYSDIFECFDEVIFSNFSSEVQEFLLKIGHMKCFTAEAAQIICRQRDIVQTIDKVMQTGSFLTYSQSDGVYTFYPVFNRYLIWKQKKTIPEETLIKNYELSALYFLLRNDIRNALKHYALAGDNEKMIELLTANAGKYIENGLCTELQEYYLGIPDKYISQSPELITVVSMIHSLNFRPAESEKYFDILADLEEFLPAFDRRKRTAQRMLIYLKIGLPHRGSAGLPELITESAEKVKSENFEVQFADITGNMPSVMNGKKDLCDWSKKDELFYKSIKEPLYLLLGEKAAGLAEIAMGESGYEKNTDCNFTDELLYLGSGMADAQSCGNIQLIFSASALMARIFVTQGKLDKAVEIIEKLIRKTDEKAIYKNMQAFLIWLKMLSGKSEEYNDWLDRFSPDEYENLYITDSYRYMIKIKIYIVKQMYTEAHLLLARLENYYESYGRIYLHTEAQLLEAIILYRTGEKNWAEVLKKALRRCEEYKFIRIVSEYGAAILPLIEEAGPDINEVYLSLLLENTRRQAVLYPRYMKTEIKHDFNLTDTEKSVLKLICSGCNNREISKLIGTTERTVKFHLGNIYKKLDVDGRIDAVNFCLENDIL